ncbi:MAG: hypothetical protein WC306_00945 [Candidatus Paceibacterota bacterium]|jgi:hypothetical protein
MRISEKNIKKITNAVQKFVENNCGSLEEAEKVKKIGEYLMGYKRMKKVNGTPLVILQLPEGVMGVIDSQGNLSDYNRENFMTMTRR